MLGIIGSILPVALKFLGLYFDWAKADDGLKKSFLELVVKVENWRGKSVQLSESYNEQLERLRKEIAESDKPKAQ